MVSLTSAVESLFEEVCGIWNSGLGLSFIIANEVFPVL